MHAYAVLADALPHLLTGLALAADDPTPEPEDVKAGWTAFAIFLALAAAVALLGWGLTRQLKRTEANRRAGAFGPVDDPEEPGTHDVPGEDAAGPAHPESRRDDEGPLP